MTTDDCAHRSAVFAGSKRSHWRETRSRVVDLTNDGKTAKDIAEILGITERSVTRHRSKAGIARVVKPPLTEGELAAARELLSGGASYEEAARTIGRDGNRLAHHLPGYAWTPQQVGHHSRLMAAFARLS